MLNSNSVPNQPILINSNSIPNMSNWHNIQNDASANALVLTNTRAWFQTHGVLPLRHNARSFPSSFDNRGNAPPHERSRVCGEGGEGK